MAKIDDASWDPAIQALVDGLDPIDWQQLELLARVPPEKRVLAGMQAQAFAMAALRGTFARRFPELTQSELNMKVLAYLTPVRMGVSAVSGQPVVDTPEDE
ncbi:MAG: hypothetical protein WHX52_02935 [Anaerolineae bacterium]